ncbi:MAG: hypothetical protein QM722_01125 [Piscinibacter sp.]
MIVSPTDLHLPLRAVHVEAEGQGLHDVDDAVGGADQRQAGADRQQRGGGEEGRALLQRHVDLAVDDAVLPGQHFLHPAVAIARHHGGEPAHLAAAHVHQPRISGPGDDEPGEREGIEGGEAEHGPIGNAAGGAASRAIRLEGCQAGMVGW